LIYYSKIKLLEVNKKELSASLTPCLTFLSAVVAEFCVGGQSSLATFTARREDCKDAVLPSDTTIEILNELDGEDP